VSDTEISVSAVSVMSFVVIPKEELYLERRFGVEYPGLQSQGAPLL